VIRRPLPSSVLLLALGCSGGHAPPPAAPPVAQPVASAAPSYTVVYAAAVRAYLDKDYAAAAPKFEAAHALDPNDATTYFAAAAHARAGETALALAWFGRLAAENSDLVPSAKRFPSLAPLPEFRRIVAAAEARAAAYRSGTEAFRVDEADLGPEGIAYDAVERAFYLGSIRHRKIVRVVPGSLPEDVVRSRDEAPIDAVLGVRVDETRRVLWAATHADEDQEGYAPSDKGRTSLLAIDLRTRALRAYPLPREGQHMLNDVAIDPEGTVYATDSDGGQVWRLSSGDSAIRPLTPASSFLYPNGVAFDDVSRTLFVADTVGVWRVDPHTGAARALAGPRGVALGSFDGLYVSGGRLIGVQPIGVGRIVSLKLNGARDAVTERRVLESAHPAFDRPTTGAIAEGALYVLADIASQPTVVLKVGL
jgi:sugar lactone lactonase YvrE